MLIISVLSRIYASFSGVSRLFHGYLIIANRENEGRKLYAEKINMQANYW